MSQPSPGRPPLVQLPLLHDWLPAHTTHAAPPLPHAEAAVPPTHTSPWQQPVGQVVALHVAAHSVPLHAWLPLHVAHALPPAPHAAPAVPAWHTLPWQHPVGQVVALHAKAHWPAVQAWFVEHAPHAFPPAPHAAVEVPGWHTLPWQHPPGHVVALQVDGVTHWPAVQAWFVEHVLQAFPLAPHAAVAFPGWHTLPWQHPSGHVVALQVDGVTQRPVLQVCPPPHAVHAPPAAPHAEVEAPGWHTLPWQHPSGHVVALQVEAVVHCPLPHACPLPHSVHCRPRAPQVAGDRPVSQRLPLQQPWQLEGEHVLPAHWLLVQLPLAHGAQAWPALPHADGRLPG